MNVAAFLNKAAHTWGDRPALARGKQIAATYREMADASRRIAAGLREIYGLRPGDRVGIVMTNCPEFMTVLFAAWQAGLAAVPINAKLHRKEFEYILENSGTRVCFTNPDKAETIAGLESDIDTLEHIVCISTGAFKDLLEHAPMDMADVEPDDLAWLFYTSGTTGRPKGAMLTHRNIVSMTMNYFCDVDTIAPEDCIIHCAPMSHASGIYGIPHVARAALQVVAESGGFEPAEMLDLVAFWPGASFFFAPTMVVRLLQHPGLDEADLTNLKAIVYGGGPMYTADLLQGLERIGPVFVQIYGQGEAPMTITGLPKEMHLDRDHPRYMERLASAGFARTDVEVAIFDADDKPVPAGEIGEIVLRGDVVMKGYWQNPEATEKALASGWLHTGDMGAMDEDGFVTLKDRSKDMIISGGTNIYPREIEEVLLTHPAVLEASVIGKPDPEWGETVFAFVVAKPGESVTEKDLDTLCLDNIARFKRPKTYRFVDALPKNNYGKILKTELRTMLEGERKAG
jgi:long-chain acyl-CoA synthetase